MENTKALCIAGQKAVTLCVRYDLTHLKVSADMARGVAVAVDEFRDYLMERSIPNLVDKVLEPYYVIFLYSLDYDILIDDNLTDNVLDVRSFSSWLMFRWQTS